MYFLFNDMKSKGNLSAMLCNFLVSLGWGENAALNRSGEELEFWLLSTWHTL